MRIIMSKLKRCTISGVVDFEKNFYKNGKYPYATFVENFRAKHMIPVEDLRAFCEAVSHMKDLELEKIMR